MKPNPIRVESEEGTNLSISVTISIKAVRQDEVQRDLDSYRASAAPSSTTAMGEALRAARSRQAEDSE